MRMVQAFSLEVAPGRGAYEDRRASLLRRGRDTGAVVPGVILEAQLAHERGSLVCARTAMPSRRVRVGLGDCDFGRAFE
jgi:hypothetical protein